MASGMTSRLSHVIQQERMSRGMAQGDVGRELGLPEKGAQGMISKWEDGSVSPRGPAYIAAIAAWLQIPEDEVIVLRQNDIKHRDAAKLDEKARRAEHAAKTSKWTYQEPE